MVTSNDKDQYAALGVDAGKEIVREIFKDGVRNDFPGAFINILRSKLFPGYVRTQHGDGDGSKSVLRILMYYITNDISWLYGLVDDAWSMNFGDAAAGGFTEGEFMVTDIINLNRFHAPKEELLKAINTRVQELLNLYELNGFDDIANSICFLGGETADLPRQVQTSVFDITVSGYMLEAGVIKGNVQPGDRIWGYGSDGQAAWERYPNSGIMSNGLTLGIDTLINSDYANQYPHLLPAGETFHGRYRVNDPSGVSDLTIAEALLSPTRQWAILIKLLIDILKADGKLYLLHGISMNTGGGATKIGHVGTGGVVYHKRMPKPPELFQLIQSESGEKWKNMFKSFNCGVGLDIVSEEGLIPYLMEVERATQVKLYLLGKCEKGEPGKNNILLETQYGTFSY